MKFKNKTKNKKKTYIKAITKSKKRKKLEAIFVVITDFLGMDLHVLHLRDILSRLLKVYLVYFCGM